MRFTMLRSDRKKVQSIVCRMMFVGLIVLLGAGMVLGDDQDEVILNRKGRKYIRERKWEKAIQTYEYLLHKHTGSLYSDDALFWIGFSYEQIPGKEREAYKNYKRVIEAYPQSPWVDDATIHQISLAKRLVQGGDASYKTFLHEKTAEPDSVIRYQAALALGELKDPGALPILEEMAKGVDTGLATLAMDVLRQYSGLMKETVSGRTYPLETGEAFTDESVAGKPFDGLLQTGESWTEEELFHNGLFHIVPERDLAFFLNLQNEWDRKEWW